MQNALNRLNKLSDIQRVFGKGRYFFVGAIGIKFIKNNGSQTRFTVVVSTKISKKAVERNKIKRRIREIIKKDVIPFAKFSCDIVVMAQKGALALSFEETKSTAISVFKKAQII